MIGKLLAHIKTFIEDKIQFIQTIVFQRVFP